MTTYEEFAASKKAYFEKLDAQAKARAKANVNLVHIQQPKATPIRQNVPLGSMTPRRPCNCGGGKKPEGNQPSS